MILLIAVILNVVAAIFSFLNAKEPRNASFPWVSLGIFNVLLAAYNATLLSGSL